jgi:hypothetical protein
VSSMLLLIVVGKDLIMSICFCCIFMFISWFVVLVGKQLSDSSISELLSKLELCSKSEFFTLLILSLIWLLLSMSIVVSAILFSFWLAVAKLVVEAVGDKQAASSVLGILLLLFGDFTTEVILGWNTIWHRFSSLVLRLVSFDDTFVRSGLLRILFWVNGSNSYKRGLPRRFALLPSESLEDVFFGICLALVTTALVLLHVFSEMP